MILTLKDGRIGGFPRYVVCDPRDLMQLPPEIRQCVCYVVARRDGETWRVGTAFFVSIPATKGLLGRHVYAVTAKHVIQPEFASDKPDERKPYEKIWLIINTKEGGMDTIEAPLAAWDTVEGSDAAILRTVPDEVKFQYLHYPLESSATRQMMVTNRIFPGESVVMTGLLVHHPGDTRNVPIVRVGNIAAFAEDPIELSTGNEYEAILVEVHSIGGLSGSPVFLHMDDFRRNEDGELKGLNWTPGSVGGPNYLLGLVHGFFPGGDEIDKLYPRTDEAMNTGITIVIPVERIEELVYGENATTKRLEIEELMKQQRKPKVIPTATKSDSLDKTADLVREVLKQPKKKKKS